MNRRIALRLGWLMWACVGSAVAIDAWLGDGTGSGLDTALICFWTSSVALLLEEPAPKHEDDDE